jgi:hypothetical protein
LIPRNQIPDEKKRSRARAATAGRARPSRIARSIDVPGAAATT